MYDKVINYILFLKKFTEDYLMFILQSNRIMDYFIKNDALKVY